MKKFCQASQILCAICVLVAMMGSDEHPALIMTIPFFLVLILFFQWGIKMHEDEIRDKYNREVMLDNDLYERGEGVEKTELESSFEAMLQFAHNQHVGRKLAQYGLAITRSQLN